MIEEWTCSMHPQIRQKEAGKCPLCGMDLIPVSTNNQNNDNPYQLVMTENAVRLANIQTTKVGYATPEKILLLNGKVQADERSIYRQTAHIGGRIEKLNINFTGEKVKEGQILAYIYSPELVNAQKELFEALKNKDTFPQFVESAKEKLKRWKLTDKQIAEIEQSGKIQTTFPMLANVSGVVSKLEAKLGDYLMEGQTLFEVTDLSKVWIMFDAYETDLSWIKEGQALSYSIPAYPDKKFNAVIKYIDPFINPETRIAKIRIEVENSSHLLKPEMFATAQIKAQTGMKDKSLLVPKTAILWSGTKSVIYVKVASENVPTFKMREVVLGAALGSHFAVKEGVAEGEDVVINGVFAIDAAAQLQNKSSMMNRNIVVKTSQQEQKEEIKSIRGLLSKEIIAKTENILSQYIFLKDELVNGNAQKAKEATQELSKAINLFSTDNLPSSAKAEFTNLQKEIIGLCLQITAIDKIDIQRKHFILLSEQMIVFAKMFGSKSEVYVQHCPMANNDKGATWLSFQQEIRNPYYGDMMLSCGEVKETIKSK
jgi:Cu(I)/Ag(I) efflux system membrane fusion protein